MPRDRFQFIQSGKLIQGVFVAAAITATSGMISCAPSSTIDPSLLTDEKPSITQLPAATETASAHLEIEQWAVKLVPGSDPEAVAADHHAENLGPVGTLPDTYLFQIQCGDFPDPDAASLGEDARVVWLERQIPKQQALKATPSEDETKNVPCSP